MSQNVKNKPTNPSKSAGGWEADRERKGEHASFSKRHLTLMLDM